MNINQIEMLAHKLGLLITKNTPEKIHLYQVYKRGKEITNWMTRTELEFWFKGFDTCYREFGNRYYHFNDNGEWVNE